MLTIDWTNHRRGDGTMAELESRSVLQAVALVFLVMAFAHASSAQTGSSETINAIKQFESSPLRVLRLEDNIYLLSGDGGNIVAISGQGDTLLIDSGVGGRTTELSEAIYKATHRPVTCLVNTDWHFDHTGGNAFFGSGGVTIVAHKNVRRSLASAHDIPFVGIRSGDYPPVALPTETYSQFLSLDHGAENLLLANYGPAHTDGDTIVYLDPGNIVVVGDIFSNAAYPMIDLSSGGSVDGIIHSVEEVLEHTTESTRVVPGHGPLTSQADLQAYHDMLVQVRDRVQTAIAAGKTMDQVVANAPTKDFDGKWGTGYITGNLFTEMVYSSLSLSGGNRVALDEHKMVGRR